MKEWLLFLTTLTSLPSFLAAEEPSPRFAKVAPLSRDLAKINQDALAGRWGEVQERALVEGFELAVRLKKEPGPAATALALRALADAALGDEGGAVCRWRTAQELYPELRQADLAAYGPPGELLAKHRWGQPQPSSPEDEAYQKDLEAAKQQGRQLPVERPVPIRVTTPPYTRGAQDPHVRGAVVVEAIIDKTGLPLVGRVLRGLPKGLDFAALNSICDWRFQPASYQGRPVKVYYVLTVNFK